MIPKQYFNNETLGNILPGFTFPKFSFDESIVFQNNGYGSILIKTYAVMLERIKKNLKNKVVSDER